MKHETLSNTFEKGGLQSVDIDKKIKALQLSWIHRLFDQKEHQWKIIPRFILRKNYGDTNVFYHHFSPTTEFLRSFPTFYRKILATWKDCSSNPITAYAVLNQRIWHNYYLKINNRPFYFKEFARANVNYVSQLFTEGSLKTWDQIKTEFDLENRLYFKFIQLTHSLPPDWRQLVAADPIDVIPTQGVLQCTNLLPLDKLSSKQLYSLLIHERGHIPTSKAYFENRFPNIENDWLKIYMLPRKSSIHAYDRVFQYKILNNILYLNKKLYQFGKSQTSLCSFCSTYDEDPPHLFAECPETLALWASLKANLSPILELPELENKFALLGFYEVAPDKIKLVNHILLLFKIYVYQARESGFLNLNALQSKIIETGKLEKTLAPEGSNSYHLYETKWRPLITLMTD